MTEKNTNIIVAGQKFDTGVRVVLWNEEEGLSFYPGGQWSKGRYTPRNINLDKLRELVDGFYIHHSVTYTAHSTFRGLLARNLSCNFIIDDDVNEDGVATIYQLLDVKDAAMSQGGEFNHRGAGVEISYYPDAWDHPDRYNDYNKKKWGVQDHKIVPDKIHGQKFSKVFAPTDAQVNSCIKLICAYAKAFPDLKLSFPRDENGNFISTTPPEDQMIGLLHHFNITKRKIDAMGFPTDSVETEVNKIIQEELKSSEANKQLGLLPLTHKWLLDKIFGRK